MRRQHSPGLTTSSIPLSTLPIKDGFETPRGTVARLGGAQFLLGSAATTFYSFSALWYVKSGYKPWQVGLVYSLMSISDPLVMASVAAVLDKLRAHNIGISVCLVIVGTMRFCMLQAREGAGFRLVATLDVLADPFVLLAFALLDGVMVFALFSKVEYPTMKIFANAGQAVAALVLGHFCTKYGTYDIIFYVHFGMCLLCALYWFLAHRGIPSIKGDFATEDVNFISVIRYTASRLDRHDLYVLLALLCIGMVFGIFQAFRMVIVESLGANARLLGGLEMVASLSEIPVLLVAYAIIRCLGTLQTLVVGLLGTAVRLLIFGVISDPKYAIAAELLSGFSMSLPFAAGVLYFSARVPEELKGSLMSTLTIILVGFGFGLGALAAGFAHEHFALSLQQVFFYAGIVTAAVAAFFSELAVIDPGPEEPPGGEDWTGV